jgi:capsular polysaccharide biosynthesis protein
MDFWDVAKLIWRRWYVAIPLLLLTIAGAVWTSATVAPDYRVTGHIAVVGPAIQRADTGAEVTRVNPWSSEALADAAAIRLQGQALADAMSAEGYRGEWSALVTGRLPVIRVEVVAERPEQAQATMQRLRDAIEQEVRSRQAEYNVVREEQISTVSYDGGETVEPVTGKVKRALIVVVAAGLILTVGIVVAFDAIARRRRARTDEVSSQAPVAGPQGRYTYGVDRPAATPVADPVPVNGGRSARPPAREQFPVHVEFAEPPTVPVRPAVVVPSPAPDAPEEDSTIVLPLSHAKLGRQKSPGSPRSTEAGTP